MKHEGSHARPNVDWLPCYGSDGKTITNASASLAVLMDIRHELQRLNDLLGCDNFVRIPAILHAIRTNTAKPRKPRAR